MFSNDCVRPVGPSGESRPVLPIPMHCTKRGTPPLSLLFGFEFWLMLRCPDIFVLPTTWAYGNYSPVPSPVEIAEMSRCWIAVVPSSKLFKNELTSGTFSFSLNSSFNSSFVAGFLSENLSSYFSVRIWWRLTTRAAKSGSNWTRKCS